MPLFTTSTRIYVFTPPYRMSEIQSLATNLDDSTRMSSVRSIFASGHPLRFCSGFCCCFCCFMLFFHRKQEQEVSRRESHRTGRSPKIVGADVQTLDGQRRDSRIPLPCRGHFSRTSVSSSCSCSAVSFCIHATRRSFSAGSTPPS